MIVGYNIQCFGLARAEAVRGESYDECMRKFKDRWENDYDVDTDIIISVSAIDVPFDIE